MSHGGFPRIASKPEPPGAEDVWELQLPVEETLSRRQGTTTSTLPPEASPTSPAGAPGPGRRRPEPHVHTRSMARPEACTEGTDDFVPIHASPALRLSCTGRACILAPDEGKRLIVNCPQEACLWVLAQKSDWGLGVGAISGEPGFRRVPLEVLFDSVGPRLPSRSAHHYYGSCLLPPPPSQKASAG